MPEQLAEESGSVSLPSKPSGEPFTCVLFPPAPWQSGRNRNVIYSFHSLALIDQGVIRARTPCCSSHLTVQTCTSRTRGPHTAAALIISLQLIMSVSVWGGFFFFFSHGKVRKQLESCDFLRYYIHYFLINVIVRFSHDTTGAWTEITAEQSPFTRTGPLSLSPTPFCNILWFWQKLSFWNLKELY